MVISITQLPEKVQKLISSITGVSIMDKKCIVHRYARYADVEIRGVDENGRAFLKIISIID